MRKSFATALLTATATASLLLLPAAPAHAQSEACAAAIAAINTAVDSSPDAQLDAATLQSLHFTLTAIPSSGAEHEAITAFANALVDETIDNLDPYTDELNRVCAA
ncbi:hypothetical protein [Nocardia brasiliensis]|uniref:hypothetical protein n=1 Tax=Nocardia brasiliensis TaxID=37326 RepID=UPI00366DFF35